MDTPLKKNWKKSENRGNRRRIRACRGGFSLVVSLVMMALMLTVAITLVSFVYVQGKLTESRLKRAQAQLNAVSGLRMALGQLQLLSGDDQRVTATGDIFGGNGNDSLPSGEAANGKRYWTGVWATGGLDKSKVRDWSVYSPDRKPFLGWLVSDYDASKEVYSPLENPVSAETASRGNDSLLKKVQEAFDSEDASLDLVTLVGRGSLGSEQDASVSRNLKEREVIVRRVPLVRHSSSSAESILSQTGSFAYWVGDEGVKARVNIPDGTDERFVRQGDWERRFNVVSQRNGVSLAEGLSRFDSWWEKDAESAGTAGRARLSYVADAQTLPLYASQLGGGSGSDVREAAQKLYHDVSYVSRGVYSDVYNGGLKTDLSVAFEMPWFSEGSWKKGFRDIEQFHGSGEKNDLNLLSKFGSGIPSDERWWTEQPEDGLGYLYEIQTGETSRNDNPNMEILRGPTWDLVRNYYRLYKREDEKKGFRGFKPSNDEAWIVVGSRPYTYTAGDAGDQSRGSKSGGWFGQKGNYSQMACRQTLNSWPERGALLPEFNGKERGGYVDYSRKYLPLIIPQSMRVTPIVRRFVIRCSIVMNQDTAALCFDPIMVIHNPYNVPIEFYGFGAYWTKFFPFRFRLTRTDTDDEGNPKNWPGTTSPVYNFGFEKIMQSAGQNVCVARVFAGTNNVSQAPSGVIRLNPGEVKTVFPHSSSIANKGLVNDNMVISIGDFPYEEAGAAAIALPGISLAQSAAGEGGEQETLSFTIDYGPYDNSIGKGDSRYSSLDQFTFYLHYPRNSEGSALSGTSGIQRVWRKYLDKPDLSDEHLAQILAVRRFLPQDLGGGEWVTNAASGRRTGGTGIVGAEKTFFAYIDVRNQPTADSPLAAPLVSNPRAWVVDPKFWDGDLFERNVGVGWEKSVEPDNGMSPVQYNDEKGFWGDGIDQSEGQTNIVLFEIPKAPLLSLGQLQHVECSVIDTEPGYVIANSYPNLGNEDLTSILFWPEDGYMRTSSERYTTTHAPQPRADTPFAANLNLFDRYFFSGVNFGDADSAQSKDMDAFVEDAFSDDASKNPFPNRRVTLIRDFGDRKEADVKEDFYDPEKIARNLLLNGAFNVNSTSVEAWKAVLAGLRGKLLDFDGDFGKAASGETPFARFMALIGSRAGGFGSVGDSAGDEGSGWRWYCGLSDDEIGELAEAVVEQVRSRGPFMSMADFVNRRLSSGDHGKAGTLQAAIDASEINASREGRLNDAAASNPDDKRYPNLFPTDWKTSKRGVPGYLAQGDVLANVGAGLSARSDTFTIRAYGDVSGLTGTPEARAWCEAVVQRVPEFFDPQEDEEGGEMIDVVEFRENYRDDQKDAEALRPEKYVLEKFSRNGKLLSVNKLFGRRYKIISFRWLSQDEL